MVRLNRIFRMIFFLHPGFCFIGDWSVLIYFYGPVGCLLLANLTFFIDTSISLMKIQKSLECHEGRRKVSRWRRNTLRGSPTELSKINHR